MEVLEIYSLALQYYRAKNYDMALQILEGFNKIVPNWAKAILLEAFIRRDQKLYVTEISLLEKFFSIVEIEQEKELAADAFNAAGSAHRSLGMSRRAIDFFINAAQLKTGTAEICTEMSNAIFAASDVENFTAADFEQLHATYRKILADVVPYENIFCTHKKLRVGYISADFCQHPAMFFAYNLITGHNKNLFDVYCYSAGNANDFVTENIKNAVTVWRDISNLTDEDAAKLIRADEIDILFELSGHSAGTRLPIMAYRPAAVQISGLGYMNSTGLHCVDYFLSDVNCAADSSYFTENIIAMDHSHFCYAPLKDFPAVNHKKNKFVTFGCFNNFSKVTDSMLTAWRKILREVPKSRLILKHKIFDTAECRNYVLERLKNLGFNLKQIELRGFSQNYLDEYNEIDIALDTFPYNGGVTTCEALYMGVPVVTLCGDKHGSRIAYSILKNIGAANLAVSNYDKYIERAISLAKDKNLLKTLHKNLRAMFESSPLMDAEKYVREVEEIYFQIWSDAGGSF